MPFLSRTLATLLLISCGTVAGATELKVLGAEAFKPAFEALAGGFERASGHKLQFVYATGGLLRDRIRAGETADVIILPKPTFDPLQAEGYIGREGSANIAQSLFSLAVPTGSPKPDISSVDALKRALLGAKAITYPDPTGGGGIGAYAGRVIERLGLTEQLRSRTTFTKGGEFREVLAQRQADMAFVLPTVISHDARIELVGPLPAELQSPTEFTFSAGLGPRTRELAAAQALIQYLRGPEALLVLRSKGLDAP
jgi:molybdate transport system substrate-binding protein